MGKKLVIVESPAKAKTINRILGKDYVVKSSMGHVRDLPERSMGVDIKNGFTPKYVTVKGRTKVVSELRKSAEGCDTICLAPDPDREGEAIAWHLKCLLEEKAPGKTFCRVTYNEITPSAVRKAFENPTELDMNRVDAQQARRVLDRLVGYMVSPLLWRRVKRGLSAGRVQSVALRLVCEREIERRNFVPEEYWILGAMVRKLVVPLDPFRVKLVRIDGEKAEIKSSEAAQAAQADLEGRSMRVTEVKRKTVTKRPSPPLITSTLQQAASGSCGFSPRRTMTIAQRLYEGVDMGHGPEGLITYMRTDSFNVSAEAVKACRDHVKKEYGEEYCPEEPNRYRSRQSAQEAHEAIRPTDVERTPARMKGILDDAEMKVYRLIWQRFVASQMTPAKIEQRTAEVEAVTDQADAHSYLFRATASKVVFPGYMKASGVEAAKPNEDGDEIEALPELVDGEPLERLEWLADRKETKPPPRYSEAALVRALESNGVGRPSTYAQILSTLNARKYVTREKRYLSPTDLGLQVNELLVELLPELFDVHFTAKMEDLLDEIEHGRLQWTSMLETFHGSFSEWMERTREPPADTESLQRLLGILSKVTGWAPPVKRGRRTFNDQSFTESIGKQFKDGEKPVTVRQYDALLKLACRYKEEIPELNDLLRDTGREDILNEPDTQPPRETTPPKLTLVLGLDLDESGRSFAESLNSQVEGGRRLSDAQLNALNRMVVSHSKRIPDFEQLREALELGDTEVPEDNESGPLLEVLAAIKEWNPPVKRGRRVLDDAKFYESLKGQFDRKGFLSVRQRAAMKRMTSRYKEQIPDFERLADSLGLRKPGSESPGGAAKSKGAE